jgi:transcriptional regulator with XRE-family HTH domain
MLDTPSKKKPNPIDQHIGARIRLRRNMIGMSQESLGEALGITFQQIQKYEKGTNRVGGSRMQAIAESLSVPVSYFFEDAPSATSTPDRFEATPTITEMAAMPDMHRMMRAFSQINDARARRSIVEIAERVAGAPVAAEA